MVWRWWFFHPNVVDLPPLSALLTPLAQALFTYLFSNFLPPGAIWEGAGNCGARYYFFSKFVNSGVKFQFPPHPVSQNTLPMVSLAQLMFLLRTAFLQFYAKCVWVCVAPKKPSSCSPPRVFFSSLLHTLLPKNHTSSPPLLCIVSCDCPNPPSLSVGRH